MVPKLQVAMVPEDDRDDKRSPGVFELGRDKVMVCKAAISNRTAAEAITRA